MGKIKSIVILTILMVLIAVCGTLSFAKFPIPNSVKDWNGIFNTIPKGIDLEGGYYAVLTPKEGSDLSNYKVDEAITTLRARLDDKGYTEATITIQDITDIRVEIPNIDNPEDVIELLGSQGELTFKDKAGTIYLKGEDIEDAYASYNEDQKPVVVMKFTSKGQSKFATATKKVSESDDKILYIYLGDTQVSAPKCEQEINNTSAVIENLESYETAQSYASIIKSGAFKIEFDISETRKISSQLGEDVVKNALISAGIGMLVIFAIMIIFYGGMGLAASLALMVYVILYVGVLAIFPWVQLTLPGIAGIILSIGMAVDANVIIFERIKEEFASGKTLKASISAGFKRALITVIDSNITTLLASIVLWIMCSGSIQGFAITLFLGIFVSMFTAIVISRWLLNVLLPLSSNKEKFYRLKKGESTNV